MPAPPFSIAFDYTPIFTATSGSLANPVYLFESQSGSDTHGAQLAITTGRALQLQTASSGGSNSTVASAALSWTSGTTYRIRATVTSAGAVELFRDGASVATGLVALAALLALRRVPWLPGAFIVLVGGIAASLLLDLPGRGVAVVGALNLDWPQPTWPDMPWSSLLRLVQFTLPLALILLAESWGTMRALALRRGDTLEAILGAYYPDTRIGR